MKFLSSSPSSSSSTTTLDVNICKSKGPTPGCLAGVFRRLLCFTSLPTQPSDQIKESEIDPNEPETLQSTKTEDNSEASGTPGIVARLMGLDSMPKIGLDNTHKGPNSIDRSRSMNYADNLREFESMQGSHRRIKSSTLSFREAPPSYLELGNEEFFILSFENPGKIKELGSKLRNSEVGFAELKQRKTEHCKNKNKRREKVEEMNKENREAYVSDGKVKDSSNILRPAKNFRGNSNVAMEVVKQSKPGYHKPNTERGRSRRKKERENCSPVKKVERECDLENTSPVSVLDFVESPVDLKPHTSEEDSRLANSNSKRKLSEKLEIYKHPCPCYTNSSIIDDLEAKKIEGKCVGSRKKDDKNENYAEMWGEICKLAEIDIMQSNWIYRDMYELVDSEDIGAGFGLEILDQLLSELVDQLTST